MDFDQLPHAELVAAYLDGEASPDERALVERLLAERPEYQQLAAELQGLAGALSSLPKRRLEVDLSNSVLAEIAARRSVAASAASADSVDSASVTPAAPADSDWFERLPLATAPRTGSSFHWWTIGLVASAAAAVLLMLFAADRFAVREARFDHGAVSSAPASAPSEFQEAPQTHDAPDAFRGAASSTPGEEAATSETYHFDSRAEWRDKGTDGAGPPNAEALQREVPALASPPAPERSREQPTPLTADPRTPTMDLESPTRAAPRAPVAADGPPRAKELEDAAPRTAEERKNLLRTEAGPPESAPAAAAAKPGAPAPSAGANRAPPRPSAAPGTNAPGAAPGAFGGRGAASNAASDGAGVARDRWAADAPSPTEEKMEKGPAGLAPASGEAAKQQAGAVAEPADVRLLKEAQQLGRSSDKFMEQHRGVLADEQESLAVRLTESPPADDVLVVELRVSPQAVQSGAFNALFARQRIAFESSLAATSEVGAVSSDLQEALRQVNEIPDGQRGFAGGLGGVGAASAPGRATAPAPAGDAPADAAPSPAPTSAPASDAPADRVAPSGEPAAAARPNSGPTKFAAADEKPAEADAQSLVDRARRLSAAQGQAALAPDVAESEVRLGVYVEGDRDRVNALLAEVRQQNALFDVAWTKRAAAVSSSTVGADGRGLERAADRPEPNASAASAPAPADPASSAMRFTAPIAPPAVPGEAGPEPAPVAPSGPASLSSAGNANGAAPGQAANDADRPGEPRSREADQRALWKAAAPVGAVATSPVESGFTADETAGVASMVRVSSDADGLAVYFVAPVERSSGPDAARDADHDPAATASPDGHVYRLWFDDSSADVKAKANDARLEAAAGREFDDGLKDDGEKSAEAAETARRKMQAGEVDELREPATPAGEKAPASRPRDPADRSRGETKMAPFRDGHAETPGAPRGPTEGVREAGSREADAPAGPASPVSNPPAAATPPAVENPAAAPRPGVGGGEMERRGDRPDEFADSAKKRSDAKDDSALPRPVAIEGRPGDAGASETTAADDASAKREVVDSVAQSLGDGTAEAAPARRRVLFLLKLNAPPPTSIPTAPVDPVPLPAPPAPAAPR